MRRTWHDHEFLQEARGVRGLNPAHFTRCGAGRCARQLGGRESGALCEEVQGSFEARGPTTTLAGLCTHKPLLPRTRSFSGGRATNAYGAT